MVQSNVGVEHRATGVCVYPCAACRLWAESDPQRSCQEPLCVAEPLFQPWRLSQAAAAARKHPAMVLGPLPSKPELCRFHLCGRESCVCADGCHRGMQQRWPAAVSNLAAQRHRLSSSHYKSQRWKHEARPGACMGGHGPTRALQAGRGAGVRPRGGICLCFGRLRAS